ncbi:unnamed protein product [Trichogramma brassicae]|uniref:Ionotropic glutamate receptor C-terminal domain-containing protein n=1 Tax=Trichogramma brassicae TaxID=86971 RepID=A0A6H5IUY6_9HYME|nr:unnamed protein product [Trichogramma brassicae]
MSKCVYWLLTFGNVSCILEQYEISLFMDLVGGPMTQAEPCFWSSYRVLVMRPGLPYTSSFNRIIRVAQAAGLVQKWWRDYNYDLDRQRYEISDDASSGPIRKNILPDKMRDHSYRNVFLLLLAGYLLSLAVFFVELTVEHFHEKLQRLWRWLPRRIEFQEN